MTDMHGQPFVISLTNHGALRQPPDDKAAAFLSQGWWTVEMLKPIIWQLEFDSVERLTVAGSPQRVETKEEEKNVTRVDSFPEGAHGDLPRPATD